MKRIKIILSVAALLGSTMLSFGQNTDNSLNPNKVFYPEYQGQSRVEISFPKVMGYDVVTCDFHSHTIFSDGLLWPTLRVNEAWRQGLDALAITDHIEYRPHQKYLNSDLNTSYNIAKDAADEAGIILIKGTEITRKQSVLGHFNALFINDANPIAIEDPKASILEAKKQGAFITWNHPGWAVDSTYIKEFQADLFKDNIIDGIEVFNNKEFYPRVLSWAIDKNLAIIAASDVHGVIEPSVLEKDRSLRPMTLVLTNDHSAQGIKEALINRRTLALFHNTIAAREDIARAFVEASISIKKTNKGAKKSSYMLSNCSPVEMRFTIDNKDFLLPKHSTIYLSFPNEKPSIELIFKNIWIYENKTLAHLLQIK